MSYCIDSVKLLSVRLVKFEHTYMPIGHANLAGHPKLKRSNHLILCLATPCSDKDPTLSAICLIHQGSGSTE